MTLALAHAAGWPSTEPDMDVAAVLEQAFAGR